MALSKHLDLRGGRSCWLAYPEGQVASDPVPEAVDVAIVGAGVMGAMLAERLSRDGARVAVFDRRAPGQGSTAASTALVMWGADLPLTKLAASCGVEEAARRWRRVHRAVLQLASRIATLDLDCGWAPRPEVYLAGGVLDSEALVAEAELRAAWGLPSGWLDGEAVAERFGITPRAAAVSGDAYEVDPVALTLGLLAKARERGARLSFPAEVVDIAPRAGGVRLRLADGTGVDADQAVLATGYETAERYLPAAFSLSSSFAIATAPGTAPLWQAQAMIWEASNPYLYARATQDGRVIVGGGDEPFADSGRRDAMIAAKTKDLETRGAAMIGAASLTADCAWAATFGTSPDGLPAIGPARGLDRLWLASGFGGNGVTFASLGSEMIAAAIAGDPDPDMACFSPERFA